VPLCRKGSLEQGHAQQGPLCHKGLLEPLEALSVLAWL
jgi:hypothetical protein